MRSLTPFQFPLVIRWGTLTRLLSHGKQQLLESQPCISQSLTLALLVEHGAFGEKRLDRWAPSGESLHGTRACRWQTTGFAKTSNLTGKGSKH